ncbi:PIR protein [Plasmodium vivax]|uniref:VIR protein n=1 Tax=Plasmodium vivax TaxID=5855 RepID=A0A565A5H3_PLAVI|nr:PIR protein [Plasmodium vivax]
MTECQGHTGDYFDYKCYQRLKEYYEKPFVSDDIVDFLDKYIKSSGEKQNFISTYYNIFVKLTNHLAGDGLAYHNKGITCKYLNYWLNQEILVRPEINEFNFVGFQSYADEHAKYKNGERSYKAKSCRNYFNYLHNDNKYKKMEILYKMYHLYKEIKEWNEKHDKTKICNNFKLIEKFYYNIINEYQGDEDLNNKLKIFKYLVIKPITPYKVSCDFTISNLMPHEIVSSPKEEPSHKQEQTLESQLPSKTDLTKGLEEKSGVLTYPTGQLELTSTGSLSESPSTGSLSESPRTGSLLESPRTGTLSTIPTPEALSGTLGSEILRETAQEHLLQLHNENPTKQKLSTVRLQEEQLFDESEEQVPRIVYEPENSGKTTSHAEGIFGQITGAFSTIVENVEPAPVLGVSGGMGALYLLLRYTPVGSFFGRRRGLNHRIPGGFPGAYPGFSEYYDGNLGNMPINVSYQPE